MSNDGIYTLKDLIPHEGGGTQLADGRWVRAMHLPFFFGVFPRLKQAWAVFREHAVAVKWPVHGEFEDAVPELSAPVKIKRTRKAKSTWTTK